MKCIIYEEGSNELVCSVDKFSNTSTDNWALNPLPTRLDEKKTERSWSVSVQS